MVASNKRAHAGLSELDPARPYKSLRLLAASLLGRSYRYTGRWDVPDLYEERLRVISHFARNPGFNLFGIGWESGARDLPRAVVESCYRGPIRDKATALRRHRYALCFENTIFPGYITEKIFDCFSAGTIPIYLGAPDIERYVPATCFVDMRKFQSFSDLEDHVVNLAEDEVKVYREAIISFLGSSAFERFSQERFVERLLDAVESVRLKP
jgi:hypothetical protein